MQEQLEQKLMQKYPKLLGLMDEEGKTPLAYWGFECGDGWYNLLDVMMFHIQNYVDQKQKEDPDFPQVKFVQIKEKFGGLRAYANRYDDVISAYISFAESIANRTCEACGTIGKNKSYNGWLVTQCDTCSDKYKQRTKREEDPEEDQ